MGEYPIDTTPLCPLKIIEPNGKNQIKKKRTRIIVPLIVVCVLISIIAVIRAPFGRPSETAELNRDVEPNKEEILATTVQAGQTYTVPETGIYKIELHGGRGGIPEGKESLTKKGSKVTGYLKLNVGDIVNTKSYSGGTGWNETEGQRRFRYRFYY